MWLITLNKNKNPVEALLTPFLNVLPLLVCIIEFKSQSIRASAWTTVVPYEKRNILKLLWAHGAIHSFCVRLRIFINITTQV